jgi:anthranilate phosphoribosyltransferase
MEYLTLELKERLEAKLAEYEKEFEVVVLDSIASFELSGKVEAIKEALEIFKEVVDYHEELDDGDYV